MEWETQQPPQHAEQPSGGGGGMYVKVMTDEQMEVLRKQIAVYATICEQLVDLHKSLTSPNELAVRLGNLYCDPLITSAAHKITGRQRWTPTPMQLQILEHIFNQGIGTPNKQKIKEIASELSQHGQISENSVSNWFQNRRARSKRKQQGTPTNNAELEVESPNEKKMNPEEVQPQHVLSSSTKDVYFPNAPEGVPAIHCVDPHGSKPEPVVPPEGSSKFGGDFGQMPFYGNVLLNPSMDQFIRKIEGPGSYDPYLQQDDYNMDG